MHKPSPLSSPTGLAELVDVEAALERLAAGSYGDCIDCCTTIPTARLNANPASRWLSKLDQARRPMRRPGHSLMPLKAPHRRPD